MTRASDSDRLLHHNATAHDEVAASYDAKHTEIYNPIEQERLRRTIADLVSMSGLAAPEVLDVGAGTGNLTRKFLALGCKVSAADVSARSLEELARKAPGAGSLSTRLITDERLPYADASFDIVATYSVLHHVPDYLFTVREMVRVLRPGGLLYIDHEASDRSWTTPDAALAEYRALTRLTLKAHLLGLIRSGEAFSYAFAKTAFMKAFVNRRYEREGDIHVWPDDHVEWSKVAATLEAEGAAIVEAREYLCYRPRGGEELFERFRNRCTDMQLAIARKGTTRPNT